MEFVWRSCRWKDFPSVIWTVLSTGNVSSRVSFSFYWENVSICHWDGQALKTRPTYRHRWRTERGEEEEKCDIDEFESKRTKGRKCMSKPLPFSSSSSSSLSSSPSPSPSPSPSSSVRTVERWEIHSHVSLFSPFSLFFFILFNLDKRVIFFVLLQKLISDDGRRYGITAEIRRGKSVKTPLTWCDFVLI